MPSASSTLKKRTSGCQTGASPSAAAYPSYEPASGERPGLPWENKPAGLGAWWETSQLCLGDAEKAFRTMRQEGGIGKPMLYAILGLLLGFMAQTLWGLPAMMIDAFGQAANQPNQPPFAGLSIGAQLAINFAFVLFWCTAGLLISAAITHACLMMVGGARLGYETTYRVTAFTAGSVAWLSIVPCFGPLIVFVMSLVCMVQGLTHAHETTVGKAIAERATKAGISQVAFDRGEYRYHGRVAALADAARESGLEF